MSKQTRAAARLVTELASNRIEIIRSYKPLRQQEKLMAAVLCDCQMIACVFADFFTETEKAFDPDAFFRACLMPDTFISQMSEARSRHRLAGAERYVRALAQDTTPADVRRKNARANGY